MQRATLPPAETPMTDAMRAVYNAVEFVTLVHPSSSVKLNCATTNTNGRLYNLMCMREDPKIVLQVFSYKPSPNAVMITVYPPAMFQERFLPGDLCFNALANHSGFLDHPTNSIPFANFELISKFETLSVIRFQLSGVDNVAAGTRLLLNKLVFTQD